MSSYADSRPQECIGTCGMFCLYGRVFACGYNLAEWCVTHVFRSDVRVRRHVVKPRDACVLDRAVAFEPKISFLIFESTFLLNQEPP